MDIFNACKIMAYFLSPKVSLCLTSPNCDDVYCMNYGYLDDVILWYMMDSIVWNSDSAFVTIGPVIMLFQVVYAFGKVIIGCQKFSIETP